VPELPEIQALSERLDAALAGAKLTRFDLFAFSALKTVSPQPDSLIGSEVGSVGRRGKFLLVSFRGPRVLVHLSQGGRVDLERPPKRTKPRGAVARLYFDERPGVLVKEFGKERKVGIWILAEGEEGPLATLGPEPDSPAFARLMIHAEDRRRIHTLLRDQRTVAGIGRGYSDDILHAARISPYASLSSLDETTRTRLLDAIGSTLAEALRAERLRDGGLPTKLGDHFTVHNRAGQPCPACGSDLKRVVYESYEMTYCPNCQTRGRSVGVRGEPDTFRGILAKRRSEGTSGDERRKRG
jgi:formamidopyrimidine-DNA glycosylase